MAFSQRYKITVEYDGTFFCGWQRQRSDAAFFDSGHNGIAPLPSVQGTLEEALRRLTGHVVLIEGAGRTDAGVHALGQVAHFDLPVLFDPLKLTAGLNFYTRSSGVVVLDATLVPGNFHARFSAKSRKYLYRIVLRRAPLALDHHRAWHVSLPIGEPLKLTEMQEAAQTFLGTHNFHAFRAAACQSKSPIKTLDGCLIRSVEEGLELEVQARSFLHNQVRIMVGTLMAIGRGKLPSHIIGELLKSGDRTKGGPTAPPDGLYLRSVQY